MLARLESAYLSLLRVVILVAATLALVVAVFGIVVSAPYFAGQLGIRGDTDGGDLAQFVSEQRGADDASNSSYEGSDMTPVYTVSALLQTSASRIVAYAKKHHSKDLVTAEIEKALASSQEQIPLGYQLEYEQSVDRLTQQLAVAKGTPLSMQKLGELLEWHDQRFQQAIAEREASKGEELVTAITAFGTAGGAFIVFVFLVFCFLFVRIERNLRLVRVVNAADESFDEAQ